MTMTNPWATGMCSGGTCFEDVLAMAQALFTKFSWNTTGTSSEIHPVIFYLQRIPQRFFQKFSSVIRSSRNPYWDSSSYYIFAPEYFSNGSNPTVRSNECFASCDFFSKIHTRISPGIPDGVFPRISPGIPPNILLWLFQVFLLGFLLQFFRYFSKNAFKNSSDMFYIDF